MKKKILIILSLIIISCHTKNNKKINQNSLTGYVKNLKDSTKIILLNYDISSKKIDSTYVKNKSFQLFLNNQKKGIYLLKIKDTMDYYFEFWYSNDNIFMEGDFNDKKSLKIKDSPKNNFLKDYQKLPNKYNDKIEENLKNLKNEKEINQLFEKYKDSIENDQIDLLLTKPNFLFSINEIIKLKHKISKDKLKNFYGKLDNTYKKLNEVKILKKYLESNQIEIGKTFLDFEAFDKEGNKKMLSNFNDKIIILDFMAFWCTWCHIQNKEEFAYLNKKYKDKLVIISYSLDEDSEVWKKSIAKDSYKWVNLSNLKGNKDPVAYKYKVNTLPHSFLINKDGIIVKEFIGYNRDSLIEKEIKKIIQ